MKQLNVTVANEVKDFRVGSFVICDEVIGYVTAVIAGETDNYIRIDWLDGSKTAHLESDLVSGYDGVTIVLYPDNLPEFAR